MTGFRDWLEGREITDRWPVNKLFYNMDDPADRRRYEDDVRLALKVRDRKIVSERLVREPYEITCWRGFDSRSLERDSFRRGEDLFLRGDRAMEGMLWFTHSLQPGHLHPREYALSHAREGYLLTYPLSCVRSYKEIRYDDGGETWDVPEGTKVDQTELGSSGIFGGRLYELPRGWNFTWQVEKHIGFKGSLKISESMLERVQT